jgi:hypothetical protein
MPVQNQPSRGLRSTQFSHAHSVPSRDQSQALRPPHPLHMSALLLAWVLGVMALAGPSGCGPAPPGDPANGDSHAALAGPSPSQQAPVSASTPTIPAASPVPLTLGLMPADHSTAQPEEPLVVPVWIATALNSPDVHVRLQALDRWGQQAPTGSVDPLVLALEDEDERVQARALALIEQDWVRGQMEEK